MEILLIIIIVILLFGAKRVKEGIGVAIVAVVGIFGILVAYAVISGIVNNFSKINWYIVAPVTVIILIIAMFAGKRKKKTTVQFTRRYITRYGTVFNISTLSGMFVSIEQTTKGVHQLVLVLKDEIPEFIGWYKDGNRERYTTLTGTVFSYSTLIQNQPYYCIQQRSEDGKLNAVFLNEEEVRDLAKWGVIHLLRT